MNHFWSKLYNSSIVHEPIVGNIHLVETLESVSQYASTTQNYFHRIKQSLAYLPMEHREVALLIFGNALYFPRVVMDEMWRFLWFELERHLSSEKDKSELVRSIQFFEVDPSGMVNHFVHLNRIQGRLDADTHARIGDIVSLMAQFGEILNAQEDVRKIAIQNITMLAAKRYWVILTDKALSGQSLVTDLRRYLEAATLLKSALGGVTGVIILAQLITSDAMQQVNALIDEFKDISTNVFYGSILDDTVKVGSLQCGLFRSHEQHDRVLDFCNWFANHYLDYDPALDRMRNKSGDNLSLGYRSCGLTVVDSDNCPTNSLPIFWYDSTASTKKNLDRVYVGPFPRTHSRIGDQKSSPPIAAWQSIFAEKELLIKAILR